MSDQTPLRNTELKSPGASDKTVAKKKSGFGTIKFFLVVILIVGSIWIQEKEMLSKEILPFIVPIAVVLSVIVVLLGNTKRLLNYFGDSTKEIKKVVWPERHFAVRMTGFVIVFAAILTVFIYGVDTIISWLFFDVLLNRG